LWIIEFRVLIILVRGRSRAGKSRRHCHPEATIFVGEGSMQFADGEKLHRSFGLQKAQSSG
jgi:hypothetical protein